MARLKTVGVREFRDHATTYLADANAWINPPTD